VDGAHRNRFSGVAFQAQIEFRAAAATLASFQSRSARLEFMAIPFLMVAAAAAFAAPHPKPAIEPGSKLITAVQACQQIKEDTARLACYDRSVSALASANARGDVAVVDREQMREARKSLFGFAIPKLPFFSGSKDKDVQQEPKQITSTLVSFRSLGNGYVRLTISEPESTWESTEPADVFEAQSGDKVKIEHGAIGSYWVEIGSNRAFHAHRVR